MYKITFAVLNLFLNYTSIRCFSIYWNVPTEMCQKFGVNFTDIAKWNIIQNRNDKFLGDKITILYDPGVYPAIIDNTLRNGGVPQEGNFTLHSEKFKNDLNRFIPDKDFSGLGIIDFEHWRPIWRENWGKLNIYREMSIKLERKKDYFSTNQKIEAEAQRRFEKFGYQYMHETLEIAQKLRRKAKWGYYGFPFCFNFTPKNDRSECTDEVRKDNDRSVWMYETSTALYPSVYLHEKNMSPTKRANFVKGRILETKRIAKYGQLPFYPYVTFKYPDTKNFLSKEDITNSLKVLKKNGSNGAIIWGSSKFTSTSKDCSKLYDYVYTTIRPILKNLN